MFKIILHVQYFTLNTRKQGFHNFSAGGQLVFTGRQENLSRTPLHKKPFCAAVICRWSNQPGSWANWPDRCKFTLNTCKQGFHNFSAGGQLVFTGRQENLSRTPLHRKTFCTAVICRWSNQPGSWANWPVPTYQPYMKPLCKVVELKETVYFHWRGSIHKLLNTLWQTNGMVVLLFNPPGLQGHFQIA